MSSFDFVMIGGGTSGLVVANRLSEDPAQNILVLEAGCDHSDDPRVNTPALFLSLLNSEADWAFETTPQTNLKGRSIGMQQGRALGGSSAINAQATKGGTGMSSEDTLTRHAAQFQPSFAGDLSHPIREKWLEAFKASGHHMTTDPFLDPSVGGFNLLSSIHPENKERSYAVPAYYHPAKHRENLTVLTDVIVEKILFDDAQPPKAIGVNYGYRNDDEIKTVSAGKEVILAAGVFQSPKLLELSGIGDSNLLQRHGINIIRDLPQVGENLQDHLVSYASYETVDNISTLDSLIRQEPDAIQQAMNEYVTKKSGMLSSVGVFTCAYLPLVDYMSMSGESHNQLKELFYQNRPATDNQQAKAFYDIAEKAFPDPNQPSACHFTALAQQVPPVDPNSNSPAGPVPGSFITFAVMLSHPLSRGNVHISSSNVSDAPIINPNYLSNPIDIEVFSRHLQYAETIANSPAFDAILKRPLRRRDPASDPTSLEQAKDYLRTSAISQWHPCGTCPMLPIEKGGVVDMRLRVYGTRNLRVVDASAIPLVSTANLGATVYAFAERAADLIKEDYDRYLTDFLWTFSGVDGYSMSAS